MLDPQQFVQRWSNSQLGERQAAQSHFIELCQMVNHPPPSQFDQAGTEFCFEKPVLTVKGSKGFADVWYKDHFAWEYKGKHKDLDAAYEQLSSYRGGLGTPPLLVVCDFLEYRIYPQWPTMDGKPIVFRNEDLVDSNIRRYLVWLLEDPRQFLTLLQEELAERGKITRDIAEKFATLAGLMRKNPAWESRQIARFLTKLAFSLFVEDIGLLPKPFDAPMFRYITDTFAQETEGFVEVMQMLFKGMDGQTSHFIGKPVPYFNGGLFHDSAPGANDGLEVLDITKVPGAISILAEVSEADWRGVNPTIFGTLFEGALDESKRSQLGAHYTDEPDIRLVVEPVLMQPLYRQWAQIQADAEPLMQTYLIETAPKSKEQAREKLVALHDAMMHLLENTRVLDPACGSGNFLYVSLRLMKDLEARVRRYFAPLNLPFRDVVTPRQLYGIEKDEFAAKLAHVVVWIGYLQWRYTDEGVLHARLPRRPEHPMMLPHPILQDKLSPDEPDRIVCADAIMRYDADNQPYEPAWPTVDVIMGNPPFLGDKKMRGEFEDSYINDLRAQYGERIPGQSDLVCYWFEKARAHIEQHQAKRAGLLATNSIRGGSNRAVLDRIKQSGDIFMAWSDRAWMLAGAAVRISIIGFDDGTQIERVLDNIPTSIINSDLTPSVDLTKAQALAENMSLSFIGLQPGGPFDLTEVEVKALLKKNPSASRILRPYFNGQDITSRWSERWIIDFSELSNLETVEKSYGDILKIVEERVKPSREKSRDQASREYWWLHQRPRYEMRDALKTQNRFLATPRIAKHRLFVWLPIAVLPDSQVVVFAREDDYFFGVLHSTIHELWALGLGTSLEDRPRYTPSTNFTTFPFPTPPGKEDTTSEAYQAISAAAKQLNDEREAWLNPPELSGLGRNEKALRERTLTNLYNAVEEYRAAQGNGKNGHTKETPAHKFAPRLAELHDALDQAVLMAYGWEDLMGRLRTPDGDEELLRRLLALNLQRAGA